VPHHEAANVSRLYNLAKADVAGYEHYAAKLAGLCGDGDGGGLILEDILDGLFHIAKADGVIHEREVAMLADIALTFGFSEARFSQILSRHAYGEADPFLTLGVERDAPFAEVRRRYRQLVAENHPDRLIARGVPEEFVAIANSRLAAINAAFESIERAARPA
jgi:DnaJ like chaperone protein